MLERWRKGKEKEQKNPNNRVGEASHADPEGDVAVGRMLRTKGEGDTVSRGMIGAQRIGEILRQAREARGVTLEQVARETRLRLPHLKAMESGDNSGVPGVTFAVGFLRLYVKYLGLPDGERLIAQYTAQLGVQDPGFNFAPPAVASRSRPSLLLILVGFSLFLGGFVLYEQYYSDTTFEQSDSVLLNLGGMGGMASNAPNSERGTSGKSQEERGEDSPTALFSAEGEKSRVDGVDEGAKAKEPSAPPSPPVTAVVGGKLKEESGKVKSDNGTKTKSDGGIKSKPEEIKPKPEEAKPKPEEGMKAKLEEANKVKPVVSGEPPVVVAPQTPLTVAENKPLQSTAAVAVGEPPAALDEEDEDQRRSTVDRRKEPTVILTASEKVWVQLQDANGKVVTNRMMEPGERFQVPQGGKFYATIGNVGGVRILVGDREISPLGKSGQVIRRLDLSAESLMKKHP